MITQDYVSNIGYIVRIQRQALRYSRKQLGHFVGLTSAAIKKLELGEFIPQDLTIQKLEQALLIRLTRLS